MGLFGGLAGSLLGGVGSALAGGILGGAAGESGPQEVTTINDLPEWLKPFYTGGEQWSPQGPPPLSQDYLHWNTAMGMGYPIGPPPPMYANDPRYTGANVYDAPFNFMQPMDSVALHPLAQMGGFGGQMGGMGGGVGPMAGMGMGGPDLSYPSQGMPEQMTPAPVPAAPVPQPEPEPGLSDLDMYILRRGYQDNQAGYANDPQGFGGSGGFHTGLLSPEGRDYLNSLGHPMADSEARRDLNARIRRR